MMISLFLSLLLLVWTLRLAWLAFLRRQRKSFPSGSLLVGFFHPYCNAGGGGERVLWTAIRAIQDADPKAECVVYTGDLHPASGVTGDAILERAKDRFGVQLSRPVRFITLKQRHWVEAKRYPYFTLLLQSLGSMVLGVEALLNLCPDVYFDTMGYAFTYPLFRLLGGCRVLAYVHYPTISADMLQAVQSREPAHNNRSLIANSRILSRLKSIYYGWFAALYGTVGRFAHVVMVNSTWTKDHIDAIWFGKESETRTATVIYPPCDVQTFLQFPLYPRLPHILSIGQFRPEKRHDLQIRAFHAFLREYPSPENTPSKPRLILLGGCRNQEDEDRVQALRKLAQDLQIDKQVDFVLNASYDCLQQHLKQCTAGVHTMWNEHFGIGVVEYMAAGVLTVAHDSGGPKSDILVPWEGNATGFLASTVESYAAAFDRIFHQMYAHERQLMQLHARQSCQRFQESFFRDGLFESIRPFWSSPM